MDLYELRYFFMWCTIVNSGLALLVFLIFAFAGDRIHQLHRRWFPISREAFYIISYSFLGLFKIFYFFVFNLVPFIALSIMA